MAHEGGDLGPLFESRVHACGVVSTSVQEDDGACRDGVESGKKRVEV